MTEEPLDEKRRESLESNDEVPNVPRLHIPRASLSSTTSSSKSSYASRLREFSPAALKTLPMREFSSESDAESGNPISRKKYNTPKPSSLHSLSSASSSLSTSGGSNQSNYSVNSLLLSVKNLENFNRKTSEVNSQVKTLAADQNPNIILKSNYYLNYVDNDDSNHFPLYEHRWKMLQNIKSITTLNVIDDDKNFNSNKKEADQLSTTSSTTTTNFTVISLNDSDQRLNKRSRKAICRRSHTITILIIVMTTIFVIFISIMLLLMDMRNQKMPR